MRPNSHIKLRGYNILIGIALTASFCSAGAAAQAPGNLAAFQACAAISDDSARLSCYDAANSQSNAAVPIAPIAVKTAASAPEKIEAERKKRFGLKIPSLPKFTSLDSGGQSAVSNAPAPSEKAKTKPSKADNSVTLNLKSTSRKANGKIRFEFENGQVWDQIDTGRVSKPKGDEPATTRIKSAALGSYLMRINNRGRSIRVKRIK